MMDYAIIKTGGKQYKVASGDVIDVELLPMEQGASVELTEVLLQSRDGKLTVGTPTIEGAKVVGEVEEHGRGPKVAVFKYKNKTRQGKKTGHRQSFTRLRITDIGGAGSPPARRRRTTRASAEESSDGS